MKLTNEKNPRVTWMTALAAMVMFTGAVTTANAQPPKVAAATTGITYNLPPQPPPPPPVTVTGCLFKGVECPLMLKAYIVNGVSLNAPVVYNVSAQPAAASYLVNMPGLTYGDSVFPFYVSVKGTPYTGMTTCMQGIPLVSLTNEVAVKSFGQCPLRP